MNTKKKSATAATSRLDGTARICEGLDLIFGEVMRRMAPPEQVRRHFDAARIEVLKGIRAMVDARIAHLEKTTRKGEKIAVE